MDTKLFDYLRAKSIGFKEYKHPAMFKVSDELEMKKNIPGQRAKSLFLKDNHNNFYLVVWDAYSKLPTNKLRKHLKVKDIEFASSEELKFNLNTTPGSVSIFAMIHAKNVRLLIDTRLWNAEYSGYHPNENTSTLVISKEDLHKFCDSLNIPYEVISLE